MSVSKTKLRRSSRTSTSRRPTRWAVLLVTVTVPSCLWAQIRTDGSVGPGAQTLSGPNFVIDQSLGRLAGSNLFHSFSTFNVRTGETANFTTSTAGIANVIGRVTGGSASQINGLIALTPASGQPNLFLINPAGVVFGAGAAIDVPGAFHVSTADYIKFPDGNFYADLNRASTFSSASPEAFGFLGTMRASVSVLDGAMLSTAQGQPISITAGDIDIVGSTIGSAGGDVRIVAVGTDVLEVGLEGVLPAAIGNLSVLDGGVISSNTFTANDAGSVQISAGTIAVTGQDQIGFGSTISASSFASGNAGSIEMLATGTVSVTNGGSVQAASSDSGNAGTVKAKARTMVVDGESSFSAISATSFGWAGDGGTVELSATDSLLVRNGSVSAVSYGTGNAGSVTVNAGSVSLNDNGRLLAATFDSGDGGSVTVNAGTFNIDGGGIHTDTIFIGKAGTVAVNVSGELVLRNGGTISSSSFFAPGDAGSVKINAGSVAVDAGSIFSETVFGSGNAGSVEITTSGALTLRNGGTIESRTYGAGNAGAVTINAGSVVVDGSGWTTSEIDSDTFGSGHAGSVVVTTGGTLSLLGGGLIKSITGGSGNGGAVKVSARDINIDGQQAFYPTGITSAALEGTGNAGSVEVAASGTLSIKNGALISSNTATAGTAGSVTVNVGTLRVEGGDAFGPSSINAKAKPGSSGQVGNVTVTASDEIVLANGGLLSIENLASVADPSILAPAQLSITAPRITMRDGTISAASSGNVNASDILINFTDRLDVDPSSISTSAQDGNGGSIFIQGQGLVLLDNSQITTSVAGLTGNGGDISIKAGGLLMNTGFIQANTAAPNAIGGNVLIDVPLLLPSGNTLFLGGATSHTFQPGVFGFNVIQAAAPTGVSGAVQITTPSLDVSGSLAGLQAKTIDAGGLGRNPCQVSGGSSFAQAGRGGLPPSARALLRVDDAAPVGGSVKNASAPKSFQVAMADIGCQQ